MKDKNTFTSLSFPLERYSYATPKNEASTVSQKHSLSDIQWLHYPHRDLEIQFERRTIAGHDEVTLKVVRGAILFEMLNITRLSKLVIPTMYTENSAHQSGIAVITRAPCIGIKWYNDVSKKIARFQMKFSTEEIFHSVKSILEQYVGKIRNAVEAYPAKTEICTPTLSVDTTSEPPTKKALTETSFMEQLAAETISTATANLLDLRLPTPSRTNKFLYLNQHTQENTTSDKQVSDKVVAVKTLEETQDRLNQSVIENKKKHKRPYKSRKNSNDLKTETMELLSKNKSADDVEKTVSPTVKPLTPPRTVSYESSISWSQEENTETLEEMIITYINDNHFLQLVKKVDKIWRKLGFSI
ncbi:hypothetical protein PCANB_002602 [Pneumocystis canis]|nr:hypothetical protein PCK1_002771 [Pneumocystis canis]KAG5438498.1 hypothetical protein PCANB_002602 [Pneumocystis canis]